MSDYEEIDLVEALGASEMTSTQQLTLFIPSKDRIGNDIDQPQWVQRAAELLVEIGGGVTIMPPVQGGWRNHEGSIVWESPILVYTFVNPDGFLRQLHNLRVFLHSLGRETNQGEVAIVYDDQFLRIVEFEK